MSERDVRDLITTAWAGKLRQAGAPNPDALALELAVVAEAHGVKLTRPAHLHDSNADFRDWPEGTAPSADYLAAKAALAASQPADQITPPWRKP
jgi:hypothetical protein